MISVSKGTANGSGGKAQHFAAHVHGNLTGHRNFAVALLGGEIVDGYAVLFGDKSHDAVCSDILFFLNLNQLRKGNFGIFQSDGGAQQLCMGINAGEGALQFTDIGFYALGDVFDDIVGNIDFFSICLFLKDGDACFKVGLLNINDKSPFKS